MSWRNQEPRPFGLHSDSVSHKSARPMFKKLLTLSVAVALSACAGIRQTDNQFTAHAECVRIVGIAIPHNDQVAARELVPANGKITDVRSTPADWTSFEGFFGNLLGFHRTTVSGTK